MKSPTAELGLPLSSCKNSAHGFEGILAGGAGFRAVPHHVGLVAWIGALLNTWQLYSKAWFIGLLLLGILNLGFFAMVAYVLAGPDGTTNAAVRRAQAATQPTPA